MNSIFSLDEWPLPLFKLNHKLVIIEQSNKAIKLFGDHTDFLELVDEASQEKAKNTLQANAAVETSELTLILSGGERVLAEVHSQWDSSFTVNLAVVLQDKRLAEISGKLAALRSRLSETNYDLLLEKERTAELLQKVRELSAPCIDLGNRHLLIPLFGDLDPEKIEAIRFHILNNVYEKDAGTVIFDMTALGVISGEGIDYMASLMQTLKVMGIEGIVTGVKPQHAKLLHSLPLVGTMHFASSLQSLLVSRHLVT